MSLATIPATCFQVLSPNGVSTSFSSIEDAIEAARGTVYLSSRQVDTHVKRLKAGESTHWSYGFHTVHIEVSQ